MNIGLVLPVMRPQHAKNVLDDLCMQSMLPNKVFLVDNGNCWEMHDIDNNNFFSVNWRNKFRLDCWRPGEGNIGTNQAWNLMWSNHFEGFDYIGLIGDDYRINRYCLESLKYIIDDNLSPAATCMIEQGTHIPLYKGDKNGILYKAVKGKGHMGFALFKRDFLLTLPQIPKEFFIFFGDNWLGHHIEKNGNQLLQINVPISHQIRYDLSAKLDYKKVISKERIVWKSYIRGEIEL